MSSHSEQPIATRALACMLTCGHTEYISAALEVSCEIQHLCVCVQRKFFFPIDFRAAVSACNRRPSKCTSRIFHIYFTTQPSCWQRAGATIYLRARQKAFLYSTMSKPTTCALSPLITAYTTRRTIKHYSKIILQGWAQNIPSSELRGRVFVLPFNGVSVHLDLKLIHF